MMTDTVPALAAGNPHADEAEQRLHAARLVAGPLLAGPAEAANQLAQAQVEATLAMVHELRTATLVQIQQMAVGVLAQSTLDPENFARFGELTDIINARIGVTK